MWFLTKVLISGFIIAFASWLAGKKPVLAGFIVALPLVSMLAILFSYIEYRDAGKVHQFVVSILVALPLSLSFFVPFLINKWIKVDFSVTYLLGIVCLLLAYCVHKLLFKMNWMQ